MDEPNLQSAEDRSMNLPNADDARRRLLQQDGLDGQSQMKYRLYTHDKALRRTINKDYKQNTGAQLGWWKKFILIITVGATFQVIYVTLTVVQSALACVSQTFQALLEKNPSRFECFHDEEGTPEGGEWRECSKEEICTQGIPQDRYRADENDDEYLDNWSQQYNLLCVEKWKIGLIGSMYYIGVIVTVILIPLWSDKIGRKWIVIINYFIFMVAILGILLASDLIWLYVFVFITGTTFAARAIVALSWLLEYQKNSRRQTVLFIKLLSYPILVILYTIIFQFGTRHYSYIWIVSLLLCLAATIYQMIIVPESASFLVEQGSQEQCREARTNLTQVAAFNEVYFYKDQPYDRYKFINEKQFNMNMTDYIISSQDMESSNKQLSGQSLDDMDSIKQYQLDQLNERIAEERYISNLVRMSIMWTAASFCLYLLQYMNKYLTGSIFINYYLDGFAGIIAVLFGQAIFGCLKAKWSYVLSFIITLLGSLGILLFEGGYISPYFIDSMGSPKSPYPPESDKDREWHLKRIIPYFTFLAKIGVNLTFQFTYYISFNDPTTFPLAKRTTAIGICNFIARLATIFAPLAAELDRPIPISIVIIVTIIGLITCLTFPNPDELRQAMKSMSDGRSKQE